MKREHSLSWKAWVSTDLYFNDLAVLGLGLFHPGGIQATAQLLSDPWWSGRKVLDVGCGNGSTMLFLNRIGAEPIGIEQSSYMRLAAFKQGLRPSQIIQGSLEDIGRMKLPYDAFDAVIIEGVLGFVENPHQTLAELVNRIAVGGRMYINDWVPGRQLPKPDIEYGFQVFGRTDPTVLARLLASNGMKCKTRVFPTRTGDLHLTTTEGFRRAQLFFPNAPPDSLRMAVTRKLGRMKKALGSSKEAERFLLSGTKALCVGD